MKLRLKTRVMGLLRRGGRVSRFGFRVSVRGDYWGVLVKHFRMLLCLSAVATAQDCNCLVTLGGS